MLKCLFVVLWVLLIGYLFKKDGLEATDTFVCDNYYVRRSKTLYAIILFSIPFLSAALRISFGDSGVYISQFNNLNTDFSNFQKAVEFKGGGELFYAIRFLFKRFISTDAQLFLSVIALFQSVMLIRTLRRYSEDLGVSVYIFVASSLLMSWMCNGVKQFIVASAIFAMTRFIVEGKWVRYCLILLFLVGIGPIKKVLGLGRPFWLFGGIHQSALIMFPIYFIARGKAFSKKVWIFILILLIMIFTGVLGSFVEDAAENTMYSNDIIYMKRSEGANPVRFLVSLSPLVLVFVKRREIFSGETPSIIHISINMSAISSVLYLASVFTSGTYVGRLPLYCELYNLILIPWLVNHPYKKTKALLTPIIYGAYLLYYLYQTAIVWDLNYYQLRAFGKIF